MDRLNYHHLRYFREVARDGNLSRVAERLNIAQSALSIQIKSLEDRLGQPLFYRVGRKLKLTEVGSIALAHADLIFGTGEDLIATLERKTTTVPPLRVGALSTLSRNFQMAFLRPAISLGEFSFTLRSGNTVRLLEALKSRALDVVLTTEIPQGDDNAQFAARRIAEQTVGIHGHPKFLKHDSLRALLSNEPLILPTDSTIRAGFESLIARLEVSPRIVANVDDMAMVRLLAREGAGLAVAPSLVLADEIGSKLVETAPFELDITEPFYAVTIPRQYPHPMLKDLLSGEQVA